MREPERNTICEVHQFKLAWGNERLLSFRCENCDTSCGVSRHSLYARVTGDATPLQRESYTVMRIERGAWGYQRGMEGRYVV